jgi:hypothetical protein
MFSLIVCFFVFFVDCLRVLCCLCVSGFLGLCEIFGGVGLGVWVWECGFGSVGF